MAICLDFVILGNGSEALRFEFKFLFHFLDGLIFAMVDTFFRLFNTLLSLLLNFSIMSTDVQSLAKQFSLLLALAVFRLKLNEIIVGFLTELLAKTLTLDVLSFQLSVFCIPLGKYVLEFTDSSRLSVDSSSVDAEGLLDSFLGISRLFLKVIIS